MEFFNQNDYDYLIGLGDGDRQFVLAKMAITLGNIKGDISGMENQEWFHKMSEALVGQDVMSEQEMKKNSDKISGYIAEAIVKLYSDGYVEPEMLPVLHNYLNKLYANDKEIADIIRYIYGNVKFETIDLYHSLLQDIEKNTYENTCRGVSICLILSQLDVDVVHDETLMNDLEDILSSKNILTDEDIQYTDFLIGLLSLSERDAALVSLLFEIAKDEYVIEVSQIILQKYYLMPKNVRKMKNKRTIIESTLQELQIDVDYIVEIKDIYSLLIMRLKEIDIPRDLNPISDFDELKFDKLKLYLKSCQNVFDDFCTMCSSWRAENGELLTSSKKTIYWMNIQDIMNALRQGSNERKRILKNIENISLFFKNIFNMYPDLLTTELKDDYGLTQEFVMEFENEGVHSVQSLMLEIDKIISYTEDGMEDVVISQADYVGLLAACYRNIIEYLSKTICERFENDFSKYNRFYELINRFPIEEDIGKVFQRLTIKFDTSKPYIEFICGDRVGINKIELSIEQTETIKVRFHNMGKISATYYIIKHNGGIGLMHLNDNVKIYSVKWGDWIDSNTVELKIIKDYFLKNYWGDLKIKITVKGYSDEPGIIIANLN